MPPCVTGTTISIHVIFYWHHTIYIYTRGPLYVSNILMCIFTRVTVYILLCNNVLAPPLHAASNTMPPCITVITILFMQYFTDTTPHIYTRGPLHVSNILMCIFTRIIIYILLCNNLLAPSLCAAK